MPRTRLPLLLSFAALAACSGAPLPDPAEERLPNVVYILADDLGYGELGSYGQRKIKTPNLDRLAAQGMRFTRHYCGAPVCAPSRCVLMTGKHLAHATIRNNKEVKPEGQHPIRAEDLTLAELLKQKGYATGAVGKWGLGPVGSSGDPNAQGFDLFYGYNCQRVAHSFYPPHMWKNRERVTLNARPVRGHHKPGQGEIDFSRYIGENYAPDAMNQEVLGFLRANRDQPFFLYFAPVEPHLAMHPPQEWVDRYPKDWDDKPYRGTKGYLPHPRPRAGYAAMISDLDEHVGMVLDELERLGVADNTLILFSSDNGPTHDVGGVDTGFFASSGGLRGRKGSVFEGGLRVPMLARWPGRIEAGSVSDHPSAFYDVMPTLAEVVGLPAPESSDGISFLPALLGRDEAQREHEWLLWEFHGYGGQQALIMGRYKYVRRNLRRRNHEEFVFDLEADPREQRNLIAEKPEIATRAKAILQRQRQPSRVFRMAALDKG